MVLNTLLFPLSLHAQDVTETPTPTQTIVQQDNQTSTPAPTPTPEGTAITTGDAGSSASSDNNVNINQTPIDGTVQGGSCGANVSVGCPIDATNEAIVQQDTSAQSNSGNNTATTEASSVINTGDAGAAATSANTINENVVVATGEASSTPEATSESDLNRNQITINNDGTLTNQTTANGTSGENQNSASQTSIDTGSALALANQFNLLNGNVIGSNFEFIVINIAGQYLGDIDINALWLALTEALNSSKTDSVENNNLQTDVNLANKAEVNVQSQAVAVSGSNTSQGEQTAINTGNSLAISNILNIINLNVIGSTFLLPVINIFGTLNGNIILPSQERFLNNSNHAGGGEVDITNLVRLNTQIDSNADSGTNTQQGSDLNLQTGDAYAEGTSTNYLNTNILGSNWYRVLINNFGLWLDNPNGTTDKTLVQGPQDDQNNNDRSGSKITIFNFADVTALAQAFALSGRNQTKSDSSIINTGWAGSLANIFNLINTNVIGSNFVMPLITVFNTWQGDIQYAYPDLAVSINANENTAHKGDTVTYTVAYKNQGNDLAKNSSLQVLLPEGESYNNAKILNLSLGNISPGAAGSFSFQTALNQPNSSTTEFTTLAQVTSSDTESDTSNNSSSTTVTLADPNNSAQVSNALPVLEVNSSTNIGEYVYPGDIVTFTVIVKNTGEGTSRSTLLHQGIFRPDGQQVAYNEFRLADINPGDSRKLTFGLTIPAQAPAGDYTSVIYSEAKADNGESVTSNNSSNSIMIKGKFLNFAGSVQAAEGKVKGSFIRNANVMASNQTYSLNYWLDALVLVLIAGWLLEMNKERVQLFLAMRHEEKEPADDADSLPFYFF